MKTINSSGFKASSVDQKALANYLLETPKEWAEKALQGMINKAVKTIMRDWFELYKSKQTEDIPSDMGIIIPGIIAMEEFEPYNIMSPTLPQVKRDEEAIIEIWEGGFEIEDYEKDALDAYYQDAEGMLFYFMENKIFQRRKAFVKEEQPKFFQTKEAIPPKEDDFINLVCSKPGYKNRATKEAEEKAAMAAMNK